MLDRCHRERLLDAIAVVALATTFLLPIAGCGRAKQSGRLKVAVSIVPLADFTREVGGDLVEVETLVPPGASPHTFEPTAGQLAFLSRAKVFVTSGLQLEAWAADVFGKVGNKGVVKVVAADAIPRDMLLKTSEADAGGLTTRTSGSTQRLRSTRSMLSPAALPKPTRRMPTPTAPTPRHMCGSSRIWIGNSQGRRPHLRRKAL